MVLRVVSVTVIDPATGQSLSPVDYQTPGMVGGPPAGGLAIHPTTGELFIATSGGQAPPARPFADPVPLVKP